MPEAGRRNGVDHRSSVASVTLRHRAWLVVAVALGGALGTVARYELALAEPVQSGRFPWATFTANLVGSLVLGIVVVALAETRSSRGVLRSFAAVVAWRFLPAHGEDHFPSVDDEVEAREISEYEILGA